MAISAEEKRIRKIVRETIQRMEELGTYRSQFDATIRTYAELCELYEYQLNEFNETGRKVVDEYTNKSGATNERKTALYMSLEKLRNDKLNFENVLGLTPSGLKKINDEMKKGKPKMSKLEMALTSFES